MTAAMEVVEPIERAPVYDGDILTREAMDFLHALDLNFEARRLNLLNERVMRQKDLDAGAQLDFLADTRDIRDSQWKVAPIPSDLLDRRVEITGPPERKMTINALNSGAKVFMADFEDSNAPSWANCIDGQRNLRDANLRTIEFTSPEGKQYRLNENPAVMFVRPRGWHLLEKHFHVAGAPMSASLFDFGLYFFHNFRALMDRGTAPYFYLPKMENHHEARLWRDVFNFAEQYVGIPHGTIRATVLIETITATFQMDEILFELRDYSAGLNCGRWDYIFSFIKKFRNRPGYVLPDRAAVTMEQPFMRSYVELLIHTCHKRGIHAMGGMAAQIPIRNDAEANAEALERVRLDKLREVNAGHDGTWVAHPGLVPVAKAVFDEYMPGPNQINAPAESKSRITAANLVEIPTGKITAAGFHRNIDVALQYIESWLRGQGCVPIYNLMEDAATAEICRAQLWQWVRYAAQLEDGRTITTELLHHELSAVREETRKRMGRAYSSSKFDRAAELLLEWTSGNFEEFLTTRAYAELA
jgi:malate synthase